MLTLQEYKDLLSNTMGDLCMLKACGFECDTDRALSNAAKLYKYIFIMKANCLTDYQIKCFIKSNKIL